MSRKFFIIALQIAFAATLFAVARCNHETVDGTRSPPYHCWPLGASDESDEVECKGLELYWIVDPPLKMETDTVYPIYYQAAAEIEFFNPWSPIFSFLNFSSVTELGTFCLSPCVVGIKEKCCIWHTDIHTCQPDVEFCWPWVQNGTNYTEDQFSNFGQVFRAEVAFGSEYVGMTKIVAHLAIGALQIDLVTEVKIIPRTCGDGRCQEEHMEFCETCPEDCCLIEEIVTGAFFSGLLLVFLVLISIPIFFLLYRKRKRFKDDSWIVNGNDIHKIHKGKGFMSSMHSMRSVMNFAGEGDDVNTGEQLFIQIGVYKGKTVAVKEISNPVYTCMNSAIQKEVFEIRLLDHKNICKFIGICLKDPKNITILTEYCPKGSLNDVMQNDDVPLNWDFRFSFTTDITKAMTYLHSKQIFHGRLTSSNCVIDDRWVVKVSDFGLPSFRSRETGSEIKAAISSKGKYTIPKIYIAPELRATRNPTATALSDVYSFGAIILEISTRTDPFSQEMMLDSNWKPKLDISHFKDNECPHPEDVMDIIQCCWKFLPQARPTFDQLKKTFYHLHPQRENPVDNMMIMMEKYSKHLETLVNERTQELLSEQKKTTKLLYSMIPQAVADELTQGKPPPAAIFHSATIFFSDIVGFTNIAGSSTPMQIVKLLNELYTTFDAILDRFDVYKVETIGDAYMVVSGVPRENGISHASEIATMALHLVSACQQIRVPHSPTTKLEIRSGINSGPVCAGVVGLKMPRYCLFGDTVNTASRMESTSEAMKIHCSDSSCQLLKAIGGFHLECRGTIDVKGKGVMVTWWVLGKDGLNENPPPAPATEPEKPVDHLPQPMPSCTEHKQALAPLVIEEIEKDPQQHESLQPSQLPGSTDAQEDETLM